MNCESLQKQNKVAIIGRSKERVEVKVLFSIARSVLTTDFKSISI